jgi:hypothetical protein
MKKQTLFGLLICFLSSCSPPCDECKQGENPLEYLSMTFFDNVNKRTMFPFDPQKNLSRFRYNASDLKITDAKNNNYTISIGRETGKGLDENGFNFFPVSSSDEIAEIYKDGLSKTYYINYDNKDIDTLIVFFKARNTQCCPEITEQRYTFNGIILNNDTYPSLTLKKN